MRFSAFLFAVAFSLSVCGTSTSVRAASDVGNDATAGKTGDGLPEILTRKLRAARTMERFVYETLRPLRQADRDNNGLDARDIELREAEFKAVERANTVRMFLLNDLDGDGRITRSEVEVSSRQKLGLPVAGDIEQRITQKLEKASRRIMAADANNDGIVTFDEMIGHGGESLQHRSATAIATTTALLALDPNKDGRLTANELFGLAIDVFRRFDSDRDGRLAGAELRSLPRVRKSLTVTSQLAATCSLPKPTAEDQVILFGVYEGEGVSTASVAGMDQLTSTGKIVIEKGSKPLYIVLTSYDAMIWRFEGHTQRVARVVTIPRLSREGPGVGVTGLSRQKVTFVEPGSCVGYFHDPGSGKALQVRAIIEKSLGRPVDILAGTYGMWSVQLPTGQTTAASRSSAKPPKGVPHRLWRDLFQFNPGGVVDIDSAAVVAPGSVMRYDVLPREAGLVQLVQEGAVRRLSDGVYHIVRPIARFPAGLAGAHSVNFLLGKGIPMPAGNSGHSCVISEDSGSPLGTSLLCR